jgi:hypothetical protein
MKERGRDLKRAAWSPCGVGIDDDGRQHPQAPMRNFIGLVAPQAREERGLREGCEATYRHDGRSNWAGIQGH